MRTYLRNSRIKFNALFLTYSYVIIHPASPLFYYTTFPNVFCWCPSIPVLFLSSVPLSQRLYYHQLRHPRLSKSIFFCPFFFASGFFPWLLFVLMSCVGGGDSPPSTPHPSITKQPRRPLPLSLKDYFPFGGIWEEAAGVRNFGRSSRTDFEVRRGVGNISKDNVGPPSVN